MTRVFQTSIEVEVKVYLEDYITGKRTQTSSAFVTYVALDSEGKPTNVAPLIVRSAEEKRRYREALLRRRRRLAWSARAHRRYFEKISPREFKERERINRLSSGGEANEA